jgi:hypothetical protein
LNRLHGILQRHSRNLNRKCATAIAFQATSHTALTTRLPLPETPNPSECPVKCVSIIRRAPTTFAVATMLEGGDHPDRLAISVCIRTRDSIHNAVMAATALHAARSAVESQTGKDAVSARVPIHVSAHTHQVSRHKASRPRCRPAATT